MSYVELGTYNKESDAMWLDIISRSEKDKLDHHMLFDVLKCGVSKARRGEIWKVLISQFVSRSPERLAENKWKDESFSRLLREETNHQHAILIDLGMKILVNNYEIVLKNLKNGLFLQLETLQEQEDQEKDS